MEQGKCFGLLTFDPRSPACLLLKLLKKSTDTKDRAALCQVYDSIFMDVPMSRVKFNVNSEYAYIQNFKVLQSKRNCPPLQSLTPLYTSRTRA